MQTMPAGIPALRTVAMPGDTNPDGDIFGGWTMSLMDLACGTFASQEVKGRVVTVAVDAMTFHKPVNVGDDVSCFCHVERFGSTSLVVHVETWVQRHHSELIEKVTEGKFTMVAINEYGKPRPILAPI
ncbi:acyl-CoA thioesterase [Amphritea balenae]|uniref:Acyl-CoA thioesterase n=1 Tax=Amphritea balenae TaxID=452629 RepID=A0A3P1SVZ7_9GAMM|nr:acyl-CoA thioesterase [Amphritea balenae]RRD01387.1 acyl-CoA thioesterase [Amphritea balenae]GGK57493.1 acyl-CoA thioesterase [Amphritea balenae]